MKLLIWSARTKEGNNYTIEWKNGEFVTTTITVSDETIGLTRELPAVIRWLHADTELDEINIPPKDKK